MKYIIEIIHNLDNVASGFMVIILIAMLFTNWEGKTFCITKQTVIFILIISTILNVVIPEKEFLLSLINK